MMQHARFRKNNRSFSRPRRGVVLLVVLVTVMILALAAYTFSDMMLTHFEAVDHNGREIQARALADSGVDMIRVFLLQDKQMRTEAGGHIDNPLQFGNVPVIVDDQSSHGTAAVTILAPAPNDFGNASGVRYGLEDESGRINLNTLLLFDSQAAAALLELAAIQAELEGLDEAAGEDEEAIDGEEIVSEEPSGARDLLMTVPGMTVDVADAILDWIDEDDEPREFGAEFADYAGLYAPANGPLTSVEELLLVRGVTPQLLFGMDQNRNGMIDAHEMVGATGAESAEGSLDRGWSAYFTLHSMEKNVNSLGEPRVDLNTQDIQELYDALSLVLSEEQVTFIIAYRQSGPYQDPDLEEGEEEDVTDGEDATGELDLTQQGRTEITSILDLIDKRVEVTFMGDDEPTLLAAVFPLVDAADFLPLLMDTVTINPNETIPGRISINHAPREILLGVPGMTEELADSIINLRSGVDPSTTEDLNRRHETWPLAEGLVGIDEMKMLSPFINAGGDVFRAQVVGFYHQYSASARIEVVVDATGDEPRIVFWRDITHLGRGYPMEVLAAGG